MTFNQPITDNDLEAGLNVSIKGNDNGGTHTILTPADTSEWWAPKKSYWRVGASLAIQVQTTWWIQGILWIAKLRHYAAKLLRNQPSAEIVRVGHRTHKRVVKCEFCGWQRRPWHEKRVERPKLVYRIAKLKIQMQCISIAQARTKSAARVLLAPGARHFPWEFSHKIALVCSCDMSMCISIAQARTKRLSQSWGRSISGKTGVKLPLCNVTLWQGFSLQKLLGVKACV